MIRIFERIPMINAKKTLVMNGDYREKLSVILENASMDSGKSFATASKPKPETVANMPVIT